MKKTPLYIEISEKLFKDITENCDIPSFSIHGLALRYGVSTVTMWRAVHVLRERGVLDCSQGKRLCIREPYNKKSIVNTASHENLFAIIKQKIVDGSYKVGDELPKFEYFVKSMHVSRVTVSRALEQLREENLATKRGKFWIVGPQVIQKSRLEILTSSEAPVILILTSRFHQWSALCVSERTRKFSDTLFSEIERCGVLTRIVVTEPEESSSIFPSGFEQIRDQIVSLGKRFAGVLIAAKIVEIPNLADWISRLTSFGKPVVWFDRIGEWKSIEKTLNPRPKNFFRCSFDERGAVKIALETLTRLGHRIIGVANHKVNTSNWLQDRIRILCEEAQKLPSAPKLVFQETPHYTIDSQENSSGVLDILATIGIPDVFRLYTLRNTFLSYSDFPNVSATPVLKPLIRTKGLTALIAPCDHQAMEYYFWFRKMGIEIPRDLSLISFDNYDEAKSYPISTVDFGFGHLGYCCAHLFLKDMPIKTTLQGAVTSRSSLFDRGSLGVAR